MSDLLSRLLRNILLIYLLILAWSFIQPSIPGGLITGVAVLLIAVGVGVDTFMTRARPKGNTAKIEDYQKWLIGLFILGAVLTWVEYQELGLFGILLSLMAGVILFGLGFSVNEQTKPENPQDLHINWKIVISVFSLTLLLPVLLAPQLATAAFKLVLRSFYVFFLGGYLWTTAIFPEGTLNLIERISLSIVLSASMLPILLVYFNRAGLEVTALSILGVNTVFCLGAIAFVSYKNKLKHAK